MNRLTHRLRPYRPIVEDVLAALFCGLCAVLFIIAVQVFHD